ncbi:hypothetical protein AWC38_SpisGene25630, partial [Stylophora pistillata]
SAKKHQESFPIFDPQGPTFEGFPAFDGDKMKKFITWVADEDKSKILATYGVERGVQILSTPEINVEDIKRLIHMNITKGDIEFAEREKEKIGEMEVDDNSSEQIGWILSDKQEAESVKMVARALTRIIQEIGNDKPDSAYIDSPLWQDVVKKAKIAYDVLIEDEDIDELLRQEEARVGQ